MKQNWLIAGAVAAMLATAAAGAGAQTTPDTTATTPMSTTTTTTTDTSTMSSGAMSTPMAMGSTPDYKLLSDPYLNYTQLKAAKARGLSDKEIATISKMSRETGYSFQGIEDAVTGGTTFPMLASEYGLNLKDVYDVDAEKQKIADYESAYETTGSMALKPGMMSDATMPMADTTSSTTTSTTSTTMTPMAPTKDVVEVAMSQKRFSTLVGLLKKADLVDMLKGPGPFTVFAPTNAAFKKLPKGTLKNLTPDQLKSILQYHVLPAKVDAATAMAMTTPTSPPTAEGSTLQVTTQNGGVMINDAKVTQADIMATNGIVHAIDTVLMPPDLPTTPASTTTGTTDTTGTTGTGTTGTTSTDTTTAPATVPPGTTTTTDPAQPGVTSTDTAPATPIQNTPDTAAPAPPAAPAPATPGQ